MPTESNCWPLVRSTYAAAAFGRIAIVCLAYLCDLVPALLAPAIVVAELVAAIGFRAFVPSAAGKGPSPAMLAATIARLEASLSEAKDESTALRARADALHSAQRRDRAALSERLVAVDRSSATLHATTNDMARAALRITTETTIVSVAAEDAFRKVSEIAGLGQDFVEMISHISDMSERSTAMGRDVVLQTETTSATIDDLLDATDEIGALTTLIAGIAHQTNLLALNATIEAARAGAHGRGFAIVASEVKSLAQETAKAAATIAAMAEAIRASSDKSIVAIKSISGSIHGLNEATADIARSVAERVEAAASLSNSISETATNVGFVSASMTKIESAVDETIQGTQFLREVAAGIAAESAQIDVLLRSDEASRHFNAAGSAAA